MADVAQQQPNDIATRRATAYEDMRRRAQQQQQSAAQQQGEALKRRFAAIGNLNSGAYVKAAQQQEQAGADAARNATSDIDAAQASEDYQRELQDRQYGFQEKVFADESKSRAIQSELARADLEESKKANAVNALIGLGNADLEGVGTDAGRINDILKAYGISSAALPKREQPKTPVYIPGMGGGGFIYV
jgi:hypothetical protein